MAEIDRKIRNFLIDRGLEPIGPRSFAGNVPGTPEHGQIPIRVVLPERFPADLPQIFVDRDQSPICIPHLERTGKLCLFPNTGILIDVSRPEAVVRDALDRAQTVLTDGLSGQNEDDYIEEFLAYWAGRGGYRSIVDPFGPTREIIASKIFTDTSSYHLFADSAEQLTSWLSKLGHQKGDEERALLLRFETSFPPPAIWQPLKNADLIALLEQHGGTDRANNLHLWLSHRRLPRFCVLSMPSLSAAQSTLVAVRLEQPSKAVMSQLGLRKNEGALLFTRSPESEATRLAVERVDPAFVVDRGGSNRDLNGKTVALVGCGSVGSRLAEKLATVGVGTLRIIDPEVFNVENLSRHILGVDDLGKKKAEAVCRYLDSRFPLQRHEWRADSVENVLKTDPDFVTADIIILSTGDETLQLGLDCKLPPATARVYVWVEPMGLGGHVLAKTQPTPGCYSCMFAVDPKLGLHNMFAFCKPGQPLQQSHSGCAGVFTPFSALDADRAANEAAAQAVDILLG